MSDHPACRTGPRRCAPRSGCTPAPPSGEKWYSGFRTSIVLPRTFYVLVFGHWAVAPNCNAAEKGFFWICSPRMNFLKKPSHRPKPVATCFSQPCIEVVDGPGHLGHLRSATNLTSFGHIVHNHWPIFTIEPNGEGRDRRGAWAKTLPQR